VFISTVRTCHICETAPNETSITSDFGFLTDKKLLNTAMTRAQSLVAVVGDPIALCAIGDCSNVWRTFVEQCEQLGSIHPSNIDLRAIKMGVQQFASHPHMGANLHMINEQLSRKIALQVGLQD
jgi:hypothetical protein